MAAAGDLSNSVVVGDDAVALPASAGRSGRAAGPAAAAQLSASQPLPVRAVDVPVVLVIAPELPHLRPQLLILAQLHVIPEPGNAYAARDICCISC